MRRRWIAGVSIGTALLGAVLLAFLPNGVPFAVDLNWEEGEDRTPIDGEATLTWHLGPRKHSDVRQRVRITDGIARTRIPHVPNGVGANWYLYLRVCDVHLRSSPARVITGSKLLVAGFTGATFELRHHLPDAGLADAGTRTWLHLAIGSLRHGHTTLDAGAQQRMARYLENCSMDDAANATDAELLDVLIAAAWLAEHRWVQLDAAMVEAALPRAMQSDATTALRCLPFLCDWRSSDSTNYDLVGEQVGAPPTPLAWLTVRRDALDWPAPNHVRNGGVSLSRIAHVERPSAQERILRWRRWHGEAIPATVLDALVAWRRRGLAQRQFEPGGTLGATARKPCLHGLQFELARVDELDEPLAEHRAANQRDRALAGAMGPCATLPSLCLAANLPRFAETSIDELAARYWTTEDPDLFRLVEALWLSGDPACVRAFEPALRER